MIKQISVSRELISTTSGDTLEKKVRNYAKVAFSDESTEYQLDSDGTVTFFYNE